LVVSFLYRKHGNMNDAGKVPSACANPHLICSSSA